MSAVTAPAPRPATSTWAEGDTFVLGSARWIIRVVRGEHVELEASNAPSGIWWTTTIDKLPRKDTP